MPEMQSHGLISGAQDLSPPSIATMTQSQGDPSRENARRGTDSSVLIFSAISVCSSKAMSSLRVSFIPTADCSVRGASMAIGCPRECNDDARCCSPGELMPSSLVSRIGNLDMFSARWDG